MLKQSYTYTLTLHNKKNWTQFSQFEYSFEAETLLPTELLTRLITFLLLHLFRCYLIFTRLVFPQLSFLCFDSKASAVIKCTTLRTIIHTIVEKTKIANEPYNNNNKIKVLKETHLYDSVYDFITSKTCNSRWSTLWYSKGN
jgi:hypothetical protein